MGLWEAEYAELAAREAYERVADPARRRRERAQLEYYATRRMAGVQEAAPDSGRPIPAAFPVRFVTDQQMVLWRRRRPPAVRERSEDVRHAVAEYARDLRRQMSRELARYAAASQREDRLFPELVVQAMSAGAGVDLGELRKLIDVVAQRRQALQRVGLLESDVTSAPQFESDALEQENVSPVIKTFAGHASKIRHAGAVPPAASAVRRILGSALRRQRAVTADERGLVFELIDGATVQPTDLSSGEQQMLVLAYQLLFETSPGTLLLVDEPEISLHVGWQSSFVDDITEMGRDRELQFLLASHSPVLIGGREDLKRSLDKPRR